MRTSPTTTTGVDLLLEGIRTAHVTAEPFAAGSRFDAVVPGWRFALEGVEAIVDNHSRWFDHPCELEELVRHPTPDGEVVEYTACWLEDGMPMAARHVHILTLDAEGRITEDRAWCGGRWPAALLAQMAAAR